MRRVNAERYDFCRSRMNEIKRKYKTSFIYSIAVLTFMSIMAIFRIRFEVVSVVASVFDAADGFISNMLGGLIQILSCVFFMVLAYFAWAYFHKLNIVFMLFYLLIFMMSIKNRNWISLASSPVGIFLYGMSSSALLEERELSMEVGYPNFQIPVEQIMKDESKKEPDDSSLAESGCDDSYENAADAPGREDLKEE